MGNLKVFRVFISSTFADFKAEREILQRYVFPKLSKACQQHGVTFLGVDLRWGISPERGIDNQTMSTCIEEIRRCKTMSPRPNFLILIGDRYGWRPLPETIVDEQFTKLQNWLKQNNTDASSLLEKWYKKDENAIPFVWILQPKVDEWIDRGKWKEEVDAPLHKALSDASKNVLTKDEQFPFWKSATHQEIDIGLLRHPEEKDHVFAWHRILNDLKKQPKEEQERYSDSTQELSKLIVTLGEELGPQFIKEQADLKDLKIPEPGSDDISSYLMSFSELVFNNLWTQIKKQIDATPSISEDQLHIEFASERGSGIVGREKNISDIEEYLSQPAKNTYLVTGKGGIGKTSLLATFVTRMQKIDRRKWITRFVGADSQIGENDSLLASIWPKDILMLQCKTASESISAATKLLQKLGVSEYDAPDNIKNALSNLEDNQGGANSTLELALRHICERKRRELLSQISVGLNMPREESLRIYFQTIQQLHDNGLIIVLDALDQLEGEPYLEHLLYKLSSRGHLPKDVWIIASTRNADHPSISGLSEAAWNQVIAEQLKSKSRNVSQDQRQWLENGWQGTDGNPLWLKLALQRALQLHSWDAPPANDEYTIPNLIEQFYYHLNEERAHGELGGRALAYLAITHTGIPENALIECLTKDSDIKVWFDKQTNQTGQKWPLERGLPPILWSRLHMNISPYLVYRNSYGTPALQFFHREFYETARDIPTIQIDSRMHVLLATVAWERLAGVDTKVDDLAKLPADLYKKNPDGWALAELPLLLNQANLAEVSGNLLNLPAFIMAKATISGGIPALHNDYAHAGNSSPWAIFFNCHYGALITHPDPRKLLIQLACQQPDDSPVRNATERWLQEAGSSDYWIKELLPTNKAIPLYELPLSKHAISLTLLPSNLFAVWEPSSKNDDCRSIRILDPDNPTAPVEYLQNSWPTNFDNGNKTACVENLISHGDYLLTRHSTGPINLWHKHQLVAQLHDKQYYMMPDPFFGGEPIEIVKDSVVKVVAIIPLEKHVALIVYEDGMIGRWKLPSLSEICGAQEQPLLMYTDDETHFTILATDEGCAEDHPAELDFRTFQTDYYHEGERVVLYFFDPGIMPMRIVIIDKGELVTQFCADRTSTSSNIFTPITDGCCYMNNPKELVVLKEKNRKSLEFKNNESIKAIYADSIGGYILVIATMQEPSEDLWNLVRIDRNLQETHRWEDQLAGIDPLLNKLTNQLLYLTQDGIRSINLFTFDTVTFSTKVSVLPKHLITIDESRLFGWRDQTIMILNMESGDIDLQQVQSNISDAIVRKSHILTGHDDGYLRAWPIEPWINNKTLQNPLHTEAIDCMSRIDETTVLSCSPDKMILWHGQSAVLGHSTLWSANTLDEHDTAWDATVNSTGELITWGEKAIRVWSKIDERWEQTAQITGPGKPINGVLEIGTDQYLFELGDTNYAGTPNKIKTLEKKNNQWSCSDLDIPRSEIRMYYSLLSSVLPDGTVIMGATDEPTHNLATSFVTLNIRTGELHTIIKKNDPWLCDLVIQHKDFFAQVRSDLLSNIRSWRKGVTIMDGKNAVGQIFDAKFTERNTKIEDNLKLKNNNNPFVGYEPTRRFAFRDKLGLNSPSLVDIGIQLADKGNTPYFDTRSFQLWENLLAESGKLFMTDSNGDLRILQLMKGSQPVKADWLEN